MTLNTSRRDRGAPDWASAPAAWTGGGGRSSRSPALTRVAPVGAGRPLDEGVGVHRPARVWPVEPPDQPVDLAPPPPAPEGGAGRLASILPLVGSLGMVAFAFLIHSLVYLVVIGVMVVAMVGAGLATTITQRRSERRRWSQLRERYTEHVATTVATAEMAAEVQRAGLDGLYPPPEGLGTVFETEGGLWERRPGDRDFGSVRLGLGKVPARRPVGVHATTSPTDRPDPELAEMAEQAVANSRWLDQAPVQLPLRRLGTVAVAGRVTQSRELVGAWLASLAARHAPGELRIVGWVPEASATEWEWLKWLPHTRDPQGGGGLGRAERAVTTDLGRFDEILSVLCRHRLDRVRRPAEAASPQLSGSEHLVILVEGWHPGADIAALDQLNSVMAEAVKIGVTVIVTVGAVGDIPSSAGAQVVLAADGQAQYVESGPGGRVETGVGADGIDIRFAELMARRMAPLRLVSGGVTTAISDSARLVELLGSDDAAGLDPAATGLRAGEATTGRRGELLAAPVGMEDSGSVLTLDLKEAAAGGMGPHGILVGATGSGKSELLRSLCSSLAYRHHPSLLNFLLVDFKGGAAFAELGRLPHCAGLVTNLADHMGLIDRVGQAITAELTRRQELLRQAGNLDSIRDYLAARASGADLKELAYLVVVVDEFGELLAAQPEFLDIFVAVGRLGRSLGVHLLLSTQRLDEGRIHGLEPHLRYRLCLRTNNAGESRSVLGSTAAFDLPAFPGLGYLKVDGDLHGFKAALVNLPYRPADPIGDDSGPLLRPLSISQPSSPEQSNVPNEVLGDAYGGEETVTDLQVLVERCRAATEAHAPHVWLDPLPERITLGALLDTDVTTTRTRTRSPGDWRVPLGLVDLPAAQAQEPLMWELTGAGGNLGVAGAPRSGKSTLLITAVASLTYRRSPEEVQVYALDLGGGGLSALSDLPHLGALVGREPETARRLVRELRAMVTERVADERRGDRGTRPRILLVIDGGSLLRQGLPDLDVEIADLAATGLSHGMHVALAVNRWFDLRAQLADALGTRLELHLGDPGDSMVRRALAATVPADVPGRGITRTGRFFQAALPELDQPVATSAGGMLTGTERRLGRRAKPIVTGVAGIVEAAKATAGAMRAPTITSLPERLTEAEAPLLAAKAGSSSSESGVGFLLGVSEVRAHPVQVDILAPGGNLLVYGDARSGRTTLVGRLVRSILADPRPCDVYLVDPRRTSIDLGRLVHAYAPSVGAAEKLAAELASVLVERVPPETLSIDELVGGRWWKGPELALVIDDYELLGGGPTGGAMAPLTNLIGQAGDLGLHLVLTRKVAGAQRSAYEAFGQRLRETSPTTLVLSGSPDEGAITSGVIPRPQPPGRGTLVGVDRPPTIVQLCIDSQQDDD